MWKNIYDPVLIFFTQPWARTLSTGGAQGRSMRNKFFEEIYPTAGFVLLAVSIFFALLFYFYLNNKFGIYYKIKNWFATMLLSSVIVGVITFILANSLLNTFTIPTGSFIIWLSVINFIYGAIVFFIISLICQSIAIMVRRLFAYDISPMGNRTPF